MKWAVVTGGTKGIGRAIAEKFASNGIHLVVCSRNEADLDEMRQTFVQNFPDINLITFKADVSKHEDTLQLAAQVLKHCDAPDFLINNAGIYIGGSMLDEPENHLPMMMETNVYSAYYLTRALVPDMKKRKKGHVVNICSIASQIAYPNGGSYSISKFAMLGFSKVLREELKDSGIKVTAVLPGATWSDSWKGADLPKERLMEASDIADSIWNIVNLSPSCVVEEIVLRPQLGDL